MLEHPFSEEIFPSIQSKPPLVQLQVGGFAHACSALLALGCAEGHFPGAAAGGLTLLLRGLVSAGVLLSQ